MPAKSEVQQQAAGAALAAKRGEKSPGSLYGASKQMYKSMGSKELRKFAKTKHTGLPHEKALVGMNSHGTTNSVGYPAPKACMGMSMKEQAARIVNRILSEEEMDSPEEKKEVQLGRTILGSLQRLQSSIASPDDNQQRDMTTIRASATTLIRMHQEGSQGDEGRY